MILSQNTPNTYQELTNHAQLRWLQRGHDFSRSLSEAWAEAYEIETQITQGEARLHPPSETVLIGSGNSLVTVYNAPDEILHDEQLVVCEDCSLQYDPHEDGTQCPWCNNQNRHGGDHDQ